MYSFCKKWSQYFKNTPCWNAVLNTRCFDRTAGSWQDISYSAGIDNLMAVSFDKGWAFIVVQCGWRKMCFLDSTLIHFPYLLVYPRIRTLCSHSLYIAWWLFFLVVVCLWIFIHWWAWFLSYFFWGRDKMSFLFTSHTSPWWLSCYGVALLSTQSWDQLWAVAATILWSEMWLIRSGFWHKKPQNSFIEWHFYCLLDLIGVLLLGTFLLRALFEPCHCLAHNHSFTVIQRSVFNMN